MARSKQRGYTMVELSLALLVLAGAGGWIANIVKLAGMGFDQITGMLVVRAVGIFVTPLGAVLGFL